MKNSPKKIKIFTLDIHYCGNLEDTDNVTRYDAVTIFVAKSLFLKSIGAWSGRETTLKGDDGEPLLTHSFSVLYEERNTALEEAQKTINIFGAKDVLLHTHQEYETKIDFIKRLQNEDRIYWYFYKDTQ